jgi:hypothetical protein
MSLFGSTTKALDSFLNNKAGQAMSKLPTGARNILGALIPGLGGGIPGVRGNNAFLVAKQNANAVILQQQQIANFTDGIKSTQASKSVDWRARLRPKAAGLANFYKDSKLLAPIYQSKGLVWQYTPQVFLSASVDYRSENLHGSNFPIRTFNHSSIDSFTVGGMFTANTVAEGRYLLAVLHFLRIATRANFGENDPLAGTPPPVLLFEYLGEFGFDSVPVVVMSWNWTLPSDVDYVPVEVEIESKATITYIPTQLDIQVTLGVMVNPSRARKYYKLEDITNGKGYKGFI